MYGFNDKAKISNSVMSYRFIDKIIYSTWKTFVKDYLQVKYIDRVSEYFSLKKFAEYSFFVIFVTTFESYGNSRRVGCLKRMLSRLFLV